MKYIMQAIMSLLFCSSLMLGQTTIGPLGPTPGISNSDIKVGAVTDDKASLSVKPAVALASGSNIALSGLLTIDGVVTSTGTLVLATAQTAASQNGPWVASSGAWTRPTWYASGNTTQAFQFVTTFIRLGTVYAGSVWRMTAPSGAITVDSTATTWTLTTYGTWIGTAGGVTSAFGRTGAVVATSGDYNFSLISGLVAAAQLPNPTASTLGGIESLANVSHKWVNAISTSGVPTATQPDYSDLTGIPTLPITTTVTGSNWLTSYNSATGLFAKSQPAFTDISGSAAAGQMPAYTGDATSSAGAVALTVKQAHWNETTVTNAGSPYTVLSTDSVILCNATAGAVTINLPAATGTGRFLTIKKTDSSANACTPTRAGSDTIDGGTSYSLTTQYAASAVVDSSSAVWSRTHINQMGGDVGGISPAAVVNKVNGVAYPASPTVGTIPKVSSSNTVTYVDFPDVKVIPAANCVNGVANSSFSSTSTGMPPACRAGSNNLNGVLQPIPSTGGTAYLDYELPGDWDTAIKPYISIYYASGANTSGTVIWTVSSACTKQDGSITDDPAWIAESAMGTQTMAVANRMWAQNAQLAGAMTNCIAGSTIYFKIVLSGTAAAAINVSKITITSPRLITIQAD